MGAIVERIDLGRIDYKEAWEKQKEYFQRALEAKKLGAKPKNILLVCEHGPVFTLGKSANKDHILEQQQSLGAAIYRVERGGDVTFHGPGQIVLYPILDLEQLKMGLKAYVEALESIVMNVVASYGLKTSRVAGASGVWLDAGLPTERKICAVGVKASRYITMHGLAFNVNTDLTWFNKIVPCGIPEKGVTSLAKELGRSFDLAKVKSKLVDEFGEVFNCAFF